MNRALLDYFRGPEEFAEIGVRGGLSEHSGFFRFGDSAICFGQSSGCMPSKQLTHVLPDVSQAFEIEGRRLCLPFDLSQVVEDLHYERYNLNSQHSFQRIAWESASSAIYYLVRPLLPSRRGSVCRKYVSAGGISFSFLIGQWILRSNP